MQVLDFYNSQGLRLNQQPPLLMVKSAELGNAASKEHHHSSARNTQRGTGAAPVFHTRWPFSPCSSAIQAEAACTLHASMSDAEECSLQSYMQVPVWQVLSLALPTVHQPLH